VRPRRLIGVIAAVALVVALGPRSATADNDLGTTQTVSVAVQLSGFETPGEVSGGGGDRCADHEPYTEWMARQDTRFVKQDELTFFTPITSQIPPGTVYGFLPPAAGDWQEVTPVVVPTHVWWITGCVNPLTKEPEPGGFGGVWVPLVTQEMLVAALSQRLEDHLFPPSVSWPSMDREFGWLYVKAPMDFRIAPPEAVTVTASVTNVTGTVTATVTATPISLTFEPGEPRGGSVSCSIASATAEYAAASPGQCSYTYQNSSAIGFGGKFGWRATLLWQVTTSSPQFPPRVLPTVSYGTVAVAEAQAVVTG
jgi:hypothetical protein